MERSGLAPGATAVATRATLAARRGALSLRAPPPGAVATLGTRSQPAPPLQARAARPVHVSQSLFSPAPTLAPMSVCLRMHVPARGGEGAIFGGGGPARASWPTRRPST